MNNPKNAYQFSLNSLSGATLKLSDFEGKKILVVNTASECGFTGQYAQLQELHELYKDKIAVIGCPCNDFGNQEPGSAETIQQFCSTRFGVTFPLSARLHVSGPDQHPLFAWFEAQDPAKGKVQWNFQKFLLSEQGALTHVFAPAEDPFSEAVLSALNIES